LQALISSSTHYIAFSTALQNHAHSITMKFVSAVVVAFMASSAYAAPYVSILISAVVESGNSDDWA
jgi:hypothetical protein